MVAAIAPFPVAHPFARGAREGRERVRGDGWAGLLLSRLGAIREKHARKERFIERLRTLG